MTRILAWATPIRNWLVALLVWAIVPIIVVLGVTVALGHSFYSLDCCSGQDCSPIDAKRVRIVFGGYLIDGLHYVPQANVRTPPPGEDAYHACFPTKDKLRCFYAPRPSF